MEKTENEILTEIDEKELDYEKTLLDLFGYSINKITPTTCSITDEDDKAIGFIQLVTRTEDNTSKQYYKAKFVKDGVTFSNLREIHDEAKKYEFISRKNGLHHKFQLRFTDYSASLIIYNRNTNKYEEKLSFIKRPVELTYIFENNETAKKLYETSSIFSSKYTKKQIYDWLLLDKPLLYTGEDVNDICLEINKNGIQIEPFFCISLRKNNQSISTPDIHLTNVKTFEEAISNSEDTLQSFARLRKLYEELSPFKTDLITMIANKQYEEYAHPIEIILTKCESEEPQSKLPEIIDMLLEKSKSKTPTETSKVLQKIYQTFNK